MSAARAAVESRAKGGRVRFEHLKKNKKTGGCAYVANDVCGMRGCAVTLL